MSFVLEFRLIFFCHIFCCLNYMNKMVINALKRMIMLVQLFIQFK